MPNNLPHSSPATQIPPLTGTGYERHDINRPARNSTGSHDVMSHRQVRKKSRSIRISDITAPSPSLSRHYFGDYGACASLPTTGTHESIKVTPVRTPASPLAVLKSALQMLNCIGAGLTLHGSDSIRVFSHELLPAHLIVENPSLCSQCSTDYVDGFDQCHRMLTLLNNVELVTRNIFNVCARHSFIAPTTYSYQPTLELLNEIRYVRDIYRPNDRTLPLVDKK